MCVLLAAIVMAIAFSYSAPKHQHVLGENKTYHICNDRIYYTRLCQDGCVVPFETKATLTDVFSIVTADESIVLDEDIVLTEEMTIKTYVGQGRDVTNLELNINLDLNNFTISSHVVSKSNDSLFMFNANRGKVNFNIKNGKLYTEDLSYIFRFKNNKYSGKNIKINIEDVECTAKGINSTPIFAHDCANIELNAKGCKFVSQNSGTQRGDYGVGVFINSDSQFKFEDCYFEGGDAVYVKSGTVDLTGCKLVNSGLVSVASQGVDTFSAVGACLTADNHTTASGTTQFAITIKDCYMESKTSYKTISVITTSNQSGLQLAVNENSVIDVQSCKFNNDPTAMSIPQYDLVKYPNNQPPVHYGTQVWICGEFEEID